MHTSITSSYVQGIFFHRKLKCLGSKKAHPFPTVTGISGGLQGNVCPLLQEVALGKEE